MGGQNADHGSQTTSDREQVIRRQQDKKVVGGPEGRPPWIMPLLLIALVALVGGVALAFRFGQPGTPVSAVTATPTSAKPIPVPEEPTTATSSAGPQPTPRPASTPTPTIAAQYKIGLDAYNRGDWATAEAAFRDVHKRNNAYPGLSQALGATYYNWGIAALNTPTDQIANEVVTATGRFEQALLFDPEHRLAQSRIDLCNRFSQATKLPAPTDRVAALQPILQELLANPTEFPRASSSFVREVANQLFATFMEQGNTAADEGETTKSVSKARESYNTASAAYTAARDLPVDQARKNEASAKLDDVQQRLAALPAPTPTARRFTASPPQPNFSTADNRNNRSSCVGGRVVARDGRGVDAAVLEVNNGNGVTARTISGGGGTYQICGMGADNWSVTLLFIPGSPPLFIKPPPAAAFSVNGEAYQQVGVTFTES